MSLTIYLEALRTTTVYDANITHNLAPMAREAGLYDALWQPDTIGAKQAADLREPLTRGLGALLRDPERFKRLNPPNGWGAYDDLVKAVRDYLQACLNNPDAAVSVSG